MFALTNLENFEGVNLKIDPDTVLSSASVMSLLFRLIT